MEKMDKEQIEASLGELRGWAQGDGNITKTFKFKDFRDAFAAMARIAFECEAMDHHPEWTNVYNTLAITLSTHDVGGVTHKDLNLAKRIEKILEK